MQGGPTCAQTCLAALQVCTGVFEHALVFEQQLRTFRDGSYSCPGTEWHPFTAPGYLLMPNHGLAKSARGATPNSASRASVAFNLLCQCQSQCQ